MIKRILIAAVILAAAPFLPAAPPFTGPEQTGRLASPDLKEASGLAASRLGPDRLWAVNDSGSPPRIHLIGTDGADLGFAELEGVRNRDWEDLASFTLDGKAYLLVAETGDNRAIHDACSLFIVEEPALPADGARLHVSVPVAWEVKYRYEDGARDCESVAVDVAAGKILLVSKRERVPRLYELPLRPESRGTQTARYRGPVIVNASPKETGKARDVLSLAWQPTAMDITADGAAAVISTYLQVLYFPRRGEETWAETFARPPVALAPHGQRGCEDVAFSKDGAAIFVTSEGVGSPVVQYRRTR